MKIFDFCKSNHGVYSSKRVAGSTLIMIGIIEKVTLFILGLFNQIIHFNELESSANWLITFGLGSLTATLFERKSTNSQKYESSK